MVYKIDNSNRNIISAEKIYQMLYNFGKGWHSQQNLLFRFGYEKDFSLNGGLEYNKIRQIIIRMEDLGLIEEKFLKGFGNRIFLRAINKKDYKKIILSGNFEDIKKKKILTDIEERISKIKKEIRAEYAKEIIFMKESILCLEKKIKNLEKENI